MTRNIETVLESVADENRQVGEGNAVARRTWFALHQREVVLLVVANLSSLGNPAPVPIRTGAMMRRSGIEG